MVLPVVNTGFAIYGYYKTCDSRELNIKEWFEL